MDKSGSLGMACHQALSFAPPAMALSRREAVFWPGCALMQLEAAILLKTAEVLIPVAMKKDRKVTGVRPAK